MTHHILEDGKGFSNQGKRGRDSPQSLLRALCGEVFFVIPVEGLSDSEESVIEDREERGKIAEDVEPRRTQRAQRKGRAMRGRSCPLPCRLVAFSLRSWRLCGSILLDFLICRRREWL